VSYKLSELAKSLPEVEFKSYCEKIEELKCNDPLVINNWRSVCGKAWGEWE
jgi:hypothetical protein